MFPNGYFPVSYYPPSYFPKTGGTRVGGGGQIVADRYRRIFRIMLQERQQRSLIEELTRMRAKQGMPAFEVLNHLQIRAEKENVKAVARAATFSALLAEV